MNLADLIVSRSRLFIATALILTLVGTISWFTMARQEDPAIPARAALIFTPFPGASAATVERLVLNPLEDALSQIDDIKTINSTARANVAVTVIELRNSVSDVEPVYDEVERMLEEATRDFPANALAPRFDRQIFDQESIVIAVTGSDDPLQLAEAAEMLEARLLGLGDVSRTIVTGDPGEQVTVSMDESTAHRLRLDPRMLAGQLSSRNSATPGGTIEVGGRTVTVQPDAEFSSMDELSRTPVMLLAGGTVPLSEIASISYGPAEPMVDVARWNGHRTVTIGVVPRVGVNLVDFGAAVDEVVVEAGMDLAPLNLDYITFQPDRVEQRLSSLGRSLLYGVLIVALVLFLFMGLRLGLTVASVVPLVLMSSLAVYAMSGGLLHQMSIAALVLALGLLVDNAIVVAENVQMRLDQGAERWTAARDAVAELGLPLGAATGTTLASFVPMLLADGPTGDFTRALPIVIMLTLSVSYLFAITITPAVSALLLKPNMKKAERPAPKLLRGLANVGTSKPWLVLVGVLLVLASSMTLAPQIRFQFFPASDRNQLVLDVTLPEGTHLDETNAASQVIETALLEHEDVTSVAAFVGRGVPHFYYNVIQKPGRPHLAQMIVTTSHANDVETLIREIREISHAELPGVEVVARRIEQGPPVAAPIELRIYGDEIAEIAAVAAEVTRIVRDAPGAVDARNDLGQGAPAIRYQINDAIAARHGLSREDVALALLGQTRGLEIGQYRAGSEPVPIVVRGEFGEHATPSQLASTQVSAPGVPPVPLSELALESVEIEASAIKHRNHRRVVSVFAQLDDGVTYTDVLNAVASELERLELPNGVVIEVGGDAEASGDSNASLMTGVPVALMLLLVFLMGEFNSFRSVAIVMATVPLAAVGVVPGLALSGEPFGFMSMLGVIALVGIVVNNAIVLLDLIGSQRASGACVRDAVRQAVLIRTRPILLTTATTVAGLLPLALSESTFWPPLAWAMISGLTASTLLTLLAVPALYCIMHPERSK
ncbi:MAG: multidrug efflux pump subunit AcrB [Bradymonadia bacterium]|jgi:multidrug efflux pump subunit AcrB